MDHGPEIEKRLPPHSREAERCVLGSLLRDERGFLDASIEVSATDFYLDAHQRIWRVFADLSAANKPFDPLIVGDELDKRKWMTDIGGPRYLIDLFDNAPITTNAAFHAKIVREKSLLRKIIYTATDMQQAAWEQHAAAEDVITKASGLIFDLSTGQRSEIVLWPDAIDEALRVLDRRAGKSADGETEGALKTGWTRFDRLTGGFHKRELIVLGARPSVGKTLVALNVIAAVAAEGGRIFFASLEQGTVEIAHRILSMRSKVNSYNFRTGQFDAMQDVAITNAVNAVRNYQISINPGSGQSLAQVFSDSRRVKMRSGLDMIIVDYLGLMEGEYRRGGRVEEIGVLTRGMKRLAKDLDVPVILLSQLNRGLDNRTDKRPRLSDLRESGDIEQDADTVLMLHKPNEKDDQSEVDELHIQVEKQRNGPCGTIAMLHHKKNFNVYEMEPSHGL